MYRPWWFYPLYALSCLLGLLLGVLGLAAIGVLLLLLETPVVWDLATKAGAVILGVCLFCAAWDTFAKGPH